MLDKWEQKKAKKRLEYLNKFISETYKEIEDYKKLIEPLLLMITETKSEIKRIEGELHG
jgi:peptidoglycan hydrolase CwlO-like protein